MKKIQLILILLFIGISTFGQTVNFPGTMQRTVDGAGFKFKFVGGLGTFAITDSIRAAASGGGSAGVISFNGRNGIVSPQLADYSPFYPSLSGSYNNPSWITGLDYSKIANVPNFLLSSVAASTYEPIISPKNNAFNVNFGTTSGTAAQGNDSRINNGQTAFGWGNHALAGYALDANVLHKTGNETKSGSITFNNNIYTPLNSWYGYNNTSPLAPIHIGNRNVLNSSLAQILVAGTYDNSFGLSGHAFSDGTLITGVGSNKAYAAYDGRVDIQGTSVLMDHYVSYQHGPTLNFTGTLKDNFGLYTTTSLNNGTLTNNYGAYFANANKLGGTLENNYGIYIANQTAGSTSNYSIYSAGGYNYFAGGAEFNQSLYLKATGQQLRLYSDGTTSKDAGIFSNSGGDIYFGNWDQTRGFVSLGNTDNYVFGRRFGINNPIPLTALDILGNEIFMGADLTSATSRTNSTTKTAYITSPHFTNSQNRVLTYYNYNDLTTNGIYFGGGSSSYNSATDIHFYTAPNNTSTFGVERMSIDNSGNVKINGLSGVGDRTVGVDASGNLKIIAGGGGGGSGTVTSFDKVDNYGITSSVTNPNTTPVHTVGVDTANIVTKPYLNTLNGTLIHKSGTESASGQKTFSTGITTPFIDNSAGYIQSSSTLLKNNLGASVPSGGDLSLTSNGGALVLSRAAGIATILPAATATTRNFLLPDKSGTVALLDDLSNFNASNQFQGIGTAGDLFRLNLGTSNTWTVTQQGVTATAKDNTTKFATTAFVGKQFTATASGTGSATTISFAHGVSGVTTTNSVIVTANNAAASGILYATMTATNVNVVYSVAPASGTNNLLYSVSIK